jgi:hypothetical protein
VQNNPMSVLTDDQVEEVFGIVSREREKRKLDGGDNA